MTTRSAAKAVIIKDDKILLQCYLDTDSGFNYYELPGGGQNPQERMEDAVVRECLEEAGYHVEIVRFLAIGEEIITIEDIKRDFPDHAHRVFHIFLCEIKDLPRARPTESDTHQTDVRWFPLEDAPKLRLRPTNLRDALLPLIASGETGYLGTSILDTFDI